MAENNMIVLDLSGSMESGRCSGDARDRAEAAKAALLAWIAANPGDNIGLVTFSDRGTRLDAPLGRGETHAEQLVAAIETARPGGATPLRSAMEQALSALEAQARRQGGLGTYRLIVITDGEASEGESPDALVARIAGDPANPVELHTIGFCIGGDHSLNDPQAVFYTDANSPEQLSAGLEATQGEAAAFTTAFEEIEP
jgi:Mg-chelatase subunit ChlD